MEDWPIAAGGEGPPIPFDLGEDVSYDVVGTKAAYQDTAAPKRRRSAVSRDKRVVNTGFARPQTASRPLPNSQPLYASQKYYFWVEVGTEVEGSIEVEPTSLPEEHLPPEAKLTVALFDFNEGLKITPGADVGEIQLPPEGRAIVIRQPGSSKEIRAGAAMLQQRLFFPVRTLEKAGRFRLRCNIYYEQILVQSRLIEVKVDLSPGRSYQRALRSKVDYTLSRSLSPATLTGMEPHRLSLFINDNGNGTHGFRFFGEKQFKGDASFDGQEIQNWITLAREALRQASWGDKEPWNSSPKRSYLYTGARNLERLKSDLVRFAIWGYTFYDAIIERLTGSVDESDELAELMKTPGMIQIALKQSARHVLPAAMIYDYGLETNASSYSLCPAFLQSIDAAVPLEQSSCFKGLCPSRNGSDDTVVCPSGFWGFRHSLGMPLSLKSTGELPSQIFWDERPELTVGVSTDKAFTLRTKHEQVLQSLRQGLGWNYADTRDAVLKLLREKSSHLVYFYCHGGMSGTVPFIQVGPATEKGITRDNLRHEKIRWKSPRPLVFINGCHTAALEPDVAMEFISAFVNVAGASGVIGTEITIFEQLARPFAEECLRNFLEGAQIGDAVRRARLKLLKDGNPLGLVYIPYVIASLSMVQKQPTK
ncbi:MAG TPA: CHAT domain-containing protein [Pyrinomonadaceae bacterium]|nr:CHAT domain-containing protein [Pyrinomonadaceae bacterium]